MLVDIYTREKIRNRSKEHIIPDFLGGRLTSSDLIDVDTNNRLGASIDSALSTSLRSILIPLDARSTERPNEPVSAVQVQSETGETYTVKAGGVVQSLPQLRVRPEGEGLHIEGTAPDRNAIRKALRKKATQQGLSMERLMEQVNAIIQDRKEAIPALNFEIGLWDTGPYRATAKIACNLLGMHQREVFMEPNAAPIQRFIMEGAVQGFVPVQAAPVDIQTLNRNPLGVLDHFVKVQGDPTTKRLTGLVVYFGFLAFVVNIAGYDLGDGFECSYRVDQLGRKDRRDDASDLRIEIPSFDDCAKRSYEDYGELARSQVERLLPEVMSIQRRGWIERIIKPHWDRMASVSKNRELTQEEHLEFSRTVAADVVRELQPSMREATRLRHKAAEEEFLERLKNKDADKP